MDEESSRRWQLSSERSPCSLTPGTPPGRTQQSRIGIWTWSGGQQSGKEGHSFQRYSSQIGACLLSSSNRKSHNNTRFEMQTNLKGYWELSISVCHTCHNQTPLLRAKCYEAIFFTKLSDNEASDLKILYKCLLQVKTSLSIRIPVSHNCLLKLS